MNSHPSAVWTPHEDEALRSLLLVSRLTNWDRIAARIPGKTSAQCKERCAHPNLAAPSRGYRSRSPPRALPLSLAGPRPSLSLVSISLAIRARFTDTRFGCFNFRFAILAPVLSKFGRAAISTLLQFCSCCSGFAELPPRVPWPEGSPRSSARSFSTRSVAMLAFHDVPSFFSKFFGGIAGFSLLFTLWVPSNSFQPSWRQH